MNTPMTVTNASPDHEIIPISSMRYDRRVLIITYCNLRIREIMCDYDFLNIELNKCYHHFCSRWNEDFVTRTPKYAKKERKGEHPDKQPHVSELFDIISDKTSISILRLVSGQGELTSPKEIIAKMKIARKTFYSIISKLENVGLLRMGEGNTNTTYTIKERSF
jgi:hypothetical protein